MSPYRFFITVSLGTFFIITGIFFHDIYKPHIVLYDDNSAMTYEDLIGIEIGGTLGVMIRDDPVKDDDQAYTVTANVTYERMLQSTNLSTDKKIAGSFDKKAGEKFLLV